MYRRPLGEDHPSIAETQLGLGLIALTRGDHGKARELLEAAIERLESTQATPEEVARVHFALARALAVEPAERARAIELARLAVEEYGRYPEANAQELAEISEWQRSFTR